MEDRKQIVVFTGGIHGSSGVNNIAGSTACQIPGEKQLEHSSGKNARISSSQSFAADSVSLPRLDTLAGTCPTHRRQWADFLAALTVLPHRQNSTARTETRCYQLLKSGQIAAQTSASRGYVFFRSTGKCYTKVLQIVSRSADMPRRSAPNLERHGSSQLQITAG